MKFITMSTNPNNELELKEKILYGRLRYLSGQYLTNFRDLAVAAGTLPIEFTISVPLAATDGEKIYINPITYFIIQKQLEQVANKYGISKDTAEQLFRDFILFHEAYHVLYGHAYIKPKEEVQGFKFNVAGDYEVNTYLLSKLSRHYKIEVEKLQKILEEFGFLVPDLKIQESGGAIINQLVIEKKETSFFEITKDIDVGYLKAEKRGIGEEILEEVLQHNFERILDKVIVKQLPGDLQCPRAGEGGRGFGEAGEEISEKLKEVGGFGEDVMLPERKPGESEEEYRKRLREHYSRIRKTIEKIRDAYEKLAGDVRAGTEPLGAEITISKLFKGRINWRELLIENISASLEEIEFTYAIPKKESYIVSEEIGHPVVYPSVIYKSRGKIIVVMDASGSTLGRPFESFMSELSNLKSTYPDVEIELIFHDVGVTRHVTIEPGKQINLYTIREYIKPAGGGGTQMLPVVNYIKEKKLDIDCAAFIWFTDGYFAESPNDVRGSVDKIACTTKIFVLPEDDHTTNIISSACTTCRYIYIPKMDLI